MFEHVLGAFGDDGDGSTIAHATPTEWKRRIAEYVDNFATGEGDA